MTTDSLETKHGISFQIIPDHVRFKPHLSSWCKQIVAVKSGNQCAEKLWKGHVQQALFSQDNKTRIKEFDKLPLVISDFYESSIEETWVWKTFIQMYRTWKGSLKKYRGSREFPGLQPRPGSRSKNQLLITCWQKTVLKATTSITRGCCGGFMFHRGKIKITSRGCRVSHVDSRRGVNDWVRNRQMDEDKVWVACGKRNTTLC